jgi:hypothetical protein
MSIYWEALPPSNTGGSVEVYEEFHEFHRSVEKNFHVNRRKRVFNFKLYNKCKYKQMGEPLLTGRGGQGKGYGVITVLKISLRLSVLINSSV